MPSAKFDFKFLAGISLSTLALLVSLYSCHSAKQLADEAFAPRLSITDLEMEGTHPEDQAQREPILHYKLQNQGRSTLRNLQIAEVVTAGAGSKIRHEREAIGALDPGTPVAQVTYLTPGLVIPEGATADAMAAGQIPLTVQFETQSNAEGVGQYRTCQRFHYNFLTQKFDLMKGCVAVAFK